VRSQIGKQDESATFVSPENRRVSANMSSSSLGEHSESVFCLSPESGKAIAFT
jgi:hypothetical protein